MNKAIHSLMLALSLVIGSTVAFAGSDTSLGHSTMQGSSVSREHQMANENSRGGPNRDLFKKSVVL